MFSRLLRRLAIFILTLLTIGFLGAALVRLSPGFGVDERELDARLSAETVQNLRNEHASDSNLLTFYFRYLKRLLKGDLGYSSALNRSIAELFRERFPITARNVATGLLGGWALGLAAAGLVAFSRSRVCDLALSAVSGLFLCLPSAVLALFFLFWGGPARFAVALIVFPKVFQYARNLLVEGYGQPHILAARSRGVPESLVFWRHVAPHAAPQLLALAGVSVSIAFGATIPIEVICDSPGIGQLAWQAALARDLPLLTNLTLVVAAVTLTANTLGGSQ